MANFSQEGSNYLMTQMAKGGTIAADTLYVGLATAAPNAASTLATITEHATAGGYARKNLTSANCNISAGGVLSMGAALQWGTGITLTAATYWFLCTSASGTGGKFIAWGALSQSRTIGTSDTMTENITDIHLS
jgi:hypothetical protein